MEIKAENVIQCESCSFVGGSDHFKTYSLKLKMLDFYADVSDVSSLTSLHRKPDWKTFTTSRKR